ncbi:hypothetical protein [Mesorhizobium sp. M0684]|uniref:hypothetical protein n=1 Tax=Mesorhizobium sp. M0684 TaxID=2956986 RepID=UPI003334D619
MIQRLALSNPHYGYRRIAVLLRRTSPLPCTIRSVDFRSFQCDRGDSYLIASAIMLGSEGAGDELYLPEFSPQEVYCWNRMRLQPMTERRTFFATLLAVLALALLPVLRLREFGLDLGFHSDKLNHTAAFAILAFVGSLGWPERKVILITFLALVGAAIEILQGTALIKRDLDTLDWAADCVGIACGLVAVGCAISLVGRTT